MIGVNSGMLRQFARGLPLVRDLRDVLMNLDGRLASLERQIELTNETRESMEHALAAASEFWRSYDCRIRPDRPPILVDLFHYSAEYVWRALVVAKLIQHITGAPLVGLLGEPGIVAPIIGGQLSQSGNMRLASAVGVRHFVEIPNEDAPDAAERAAHAALDELATSGPDGMPLPPAAIAKLREIRTESGFPIGRSIQDTLMRAEGEPTVLAGHRLMHWTRRVLGFFGFAEQLIASMRPSVFVSGHLDYCPWGTLAELLVRRGGRVVWFREECRLPLHILDHIDESSTLNGMIRRIERDAFSQFEHEIDAEPSVAERADALAQASATALRNGVGRHYRWVAADPVPGAPAAQMPFQNAPLPTYCLFTHTFTDQPAADESLFVDYLEWVEETCRHAAATGAYNLLVKVHPLDGAYDRSGAVDHLAEMFAVAANVHFMRDHIEPEQLIQHCALGLTVRGTPGLTMTASGLPMMAVGRGLYSDTGICLEPRSRAEYFDLLTSGPPFPIDMVTQSRRARRYLAFDRNWSAPMTPLVPAFNCRTADDPNLWTLIGDGLRSACLETDQVLRALTRAWPKGSAKVVAPEIDGLVAGVS
jgi:hypothetical protein